MAANSETRYGPLDEWGIEDYLATLARSEDLGKRMKNAEECRVCLRSRGITDKAFEIYNTLDFLNRHSEELSSNPAAGVSYSNLETVRYAITDIAIPIGYYGCCLDGESVLKIKVYPVEVVDDEILENSKKDPAYFKSPVYLAIDSENRAPGDYLVGKREQIDLLVPNLIKVCSPVEYDFPEDSGCRELEGLAGSFPKGAKAYFFDRNALAAGAKQSFFNRLLNMGHSLEDLLLLEMVSQEYTEVDGAVRRRVSDYRSAEKLPGYI